MKTKGDKFSVGHHYKHEFNNFLKYSLLSINVCKCPIQKKEMVKEILIAVSINFINDTFIYFLNFI